MKKTAHLLLLLYIISTFGTTTAQEKAGNAENASYSYPIPVYDPRLQVKNVSFTRRHADNGKGEFLDVQIDITNLSTESVNYKTYILAIHEQDDMAKYDDPLLPYPTWRKTMPEKDKKVVLFSNLMPQNVSPKEIWGEELYQKKLKEVEEKQLLGYKVQLEEPNMNEYIQYLLRTPDKALDFTLYGERGPVKEKVLVHNYIGQTEEEKKLQKHDTLGKHTYTVYNNKYNSSVISHHYAEYRPGYITFNKVVLMIFDPQRPKNKLVYRKIIEIDKVKLTY